MAEKCKNAYRKRGHAAVYCKVIGGEYGICPFQQMCYKSNRFEATSSSSICKMRHENPVSNDN